MQSNEVSSSYHMEKEGLACVLKFLEDHGLEVEVLVTDRQSSQYSPSQVWYVTCNWFCPSPRFLFTVKIKLLVVRIKNLLSLQSRHDP